MNKTLISRLMEQFPHAELSQVVKQMLIAQ